MSVPPIDERDRLFSLPRQVEAADTRSLGTDLASAVRDAAGLLGRLRRRLGLILGLALAFGAMGAAYGYLTPATYKSTTRVMIDPREPQVVPGAFVPGAQTPDIVRLESQVAIITSYNVLAAAHAALGSAPESPGVVDRLRALVDGEAPRREAGTDRAIEALARSVTVDRVPGTYVLELTAQAHTPERAQAVADAVVAAYLEDQARAERDELGRAGRLLDERLEGLRARVREAEAAVQDFARLNGIVRAGETEIDGQQLALLNQEYAAARADASAARARLEAVERVARGEAGIDALPQAVSSGTVQSLRAALTEALDREAALASELLPNHPRMVRAREQVEGLQAQLRAELGRAAQSVRDEFRIAEDREREMLARVEEAASRTTALDERMIELRALQREAAASQGVLNDYLSRMNEVTEQVGLQLPTARVLSPASLPHRPSSLPPLVLALLAAVAGACIGAAIALTAEALAPAQAPQPRALRTA
ncbi:GumC family protein [Salinarimonas rosea]|uniref:GumC family protein n=1 Tax=Salinarimonas rosea TaxID=552063 RepID=UPI0003F53A7D|nr:GumC family protein [Salinarimonas rosea]